MAKVFIKVEMVVCGDKIVPNSEFATTAKVGCKIYFDATAKDAQGKPTRPGGPLVWTFTPEELVEPHQVDPYAPVLDVLAPGELTVYVVVDKVKSNTLFVTLEK